MGPLILVTGATGNVGSLLLQLFDARGVPARAAVRDPARAASLPGSVERTTFDFADPRTFHAALEGVDRVFLVRPPHMAKAEAFGPFIDAMREAGVDQVVFLSLLGVERNPFVPHHGIEKRLRDSGLGWTMLRPGFYMQNLSTTHLADIRDRGEIVVPAGRGATSLIDARDIAQAALTVLTRPGHVGRSYSLTGPEALTYAQCARAISDATGRSVRYANPSSRAFAAHMRANGHPEEYVTVMRGIYLLAKLGMAGRITDDLALLTGREPTTFERFALDHADVFAPKVPY